MADRSPAPAMPQPPAGGATPPALLAARVRADPHGPLLTALDHATGERTELSAATFANWVHKTANMLVEELEIGPGARLALRLPTSWPAAVWAFAAWEVGALVDLRGTAAADVVVVREDGGPPPGGAQVVVVGTGLGARLVGPAPAGALPWAEEVLAFGDDYDGPDPGADVPALAVGAGDLTQGALDQGAVASGGHAVAAWGGWDAGTRVLDLLGSADVGRLVLAHVGALAAGGATIQVASADAARLARTAAQERADVALVPAGVEVLPAGLPALRLAPGVPAQDLAVGWGLSEAAAAAAFTPADADDATRRWLAAQDGVPAGCPSAACDVVALDPDGVALPDGTAGGLAVGGPVLAGGLADARGWWRTGATGAVLEGPDGRRHVVLAPAQPVRTTTSR